MSIDQALKKQLDPLQKTLTNEFQTLVNRGVAEGFIVPIDLFEQQARRAAQAFGVGTTQEFLKIRDEFKTGLIDESIYRNSLANLVGITNKETAKIVANLKTITGVETLDRTPINGFVDGLKLAGKNLRILKDEGFEFTENRIIPFEVIPIESQVAAFKQDSQKLKDEIRTVQELVKEQDIIDLFKNIDFDKFKSFKEIIEAIKEPISTLAVGLGGENGLVAGFLSLDTLFRQQDNIISKLFDFNYSLEQGNILLPTHIGLIDSEADSMGNLANETGRAADAQERLNRAKGSSEGFFERVGSSIDSTFSSVVRS